MSDPAPPPWLDLPNHVTEKILERLPLSDYLRFAAVCRQWRSIQADHQRRYAPFPPPILKLPWLIPLEPQPEEESSCCFSPFEGRTYRIKLPAYIDSSPNCGWLLRSDSIVNPISGVEIRFPEPLDDDDIDLIAVSPPPDLVVFVVMDGGDLLIFRPGDPQWTRLPLLVAEGQYEVVTAAVALSGKLYCIHSHHELSLNDHFTVVDSVPTPPSVCSYRMNDWVKVLPQEPPGWALSLAHTWLVESDGEMLLVKMIRSWPFECSLSFMIFRPDVSKRMWMRVESLGDRLLILHSMLCSVSMLAADVGLRENCIYYSPVLMHGSCRWEAFDLAAGKVMEVSFPSAPPGKEDGWRRMFLPCTC